MFVNTSIDNFVNAVVNDKTGKTVLIHGGLDNEYMQYSKSKDCLLKSVGDYEIFQDLVFFMRNGTPQAHTINAEIITMRRNLQFDIYIDRSVV